MRYGISGTADRALVRAHPDLGGEAADFMMRRVAEKIMLLPDATAFVSGAQYGVDTIAAGVASEIFPSAEHVIIVPDAPHNEPFVARWPGAVLRMPPTPARAGESESARRGRAYRARNLRVVTLTDKLLAWPWLPEDRALRSGTWMTVRMARKAGHPVAVDVLSDEPSAADLFLADLRAEVAR